MRYMAYLSAIGLLLGACAVDESIDREANVELAPMPKPASLPAELRYLDDGEPIVQKRIARDGDMATWQEVEGPDAGCQWTVEGWFAPAASWENCDGSSGGHTYTKEGEIWPLSVGKTMSFDVEGQSGNDSWETTRNCEVTDAVAVTIEGKNYPTYEVVCTDSSRRRTWYVSPDLGMPLKYKNVHKRRGVLTDMVAILS